MNAYIVPFALIVIGSFVLHYGAQFPEYSDTNAESLLNDGKWFAREAEPSTADEWYALKAKIQTRRDACQDLGAGIIAIGLSTVILFLMQGVSSLADVARLTTPTTPGRFYLFAALTWLSFVPAEWIYYVYTYVRGDYPPFGDIIFIPMAGELIFGVVILPVVLVGVWAVIRGVKLPSCIWTRPVWGRCSVVTVGIWIALGVAACVTVMGVTMRPPIVPCGVFAIYLLLSGRALAGQRARPAP